MEVITAQGVGLKPSARLAGRFYHPDIMLLDIENAAPWMDFEGPPGCAMTRAFDGICRSS